jgi:hypothetical protein
MAGPSAVIAQNAVHRYRCEHTKVFCQSGKQLGAVAKSRISAHSAASRRRFFELGLHVFHIAAFHVPLREHYKCLFLVTSERSKTPKLD